MAIIQHDIDEMMNGNHGEHIHSGYVSEEFLQFISDPRVSRVYPMILGDLTYRYGDKEVHMAQGGNRYYLVSIQKIEDWKESEINALPFDELLNDEPSIVYNRNIPPRYWFTPDHK